MLDDGDALSADDLFRLSVRALRVHRRHPRGAVFVAAGRDAGAETVFTDRRRVVARGVRRHGRRRGAQADEYDGADAARHSGLRRAAALREQTHQGRRGDRHALRQLAGAGLPDHERVLALGQPLVIFVYSYLNILDFLN